MKDKPFNYPADFSKYFYYFVSFTAVTLLITFFLLQRYATNVVAQELAQTAKEEVEEISQIVRDELYASKRLLRSIQDSPFFKRWQENPQNDQHYKNLSFHIITLLKANPDVYQLRYLDSSGRERLRTQLDDSGKGPVVIPKNKLQDKSHRYYFQKLKSSTQNYISEFDLNEEERKVAIPYSPTIRVGMPVIKDGIFDGALVLNLRVSKILSNLQGLHFFRAYLTEYREHFLYHPVKGRSWSRQLESDWTVENEFSGYIMSDNSLTINLDKNLYRVSLEEIFQNGQGIELILQLKDEFKNHNLENYLISFFSILSFVLLLSVFGAWFVARQLSRQGAALKKVLHENNKWLKVIDENVIQLTITPDGSIKKISQAYLELSGYAEHELIGQKISILQSGDTPREVYNQLWETVSRDCDQWRGQIKNCSKEGGPFWVDLKIMPSCDERGNPQAFEAIGKDISNLKEVEALADIDILTGLYNRHKLNTELSAGIKRFKEENIPLSLIILDVDHFKSVNDMFGHNKGDEVLKHIAKTLNENVRLMDVVGRWGGEEFLIICSETDKDQAVRLAENLKSAVSREKIETVGHITCSFGVSQFVDNESMIDCIGRADEALYNAKRSGRNRVSSV